MKHVAIFPAGYLEERGSPSRLASLQVLSGVSKALSQPVLVQQPLIQKRQFHNLSITNDAPATMVSEAANMLVPDAFFKCIDRGGNIHRRYFAAFPLFLSLSSTNPREWWIFRVGAVFYFNP